MELLGELVSIGTLLAFAIVCIGVLLLRLFQPDLPRPFKTPAVWFVAPAGAASSVFLMFGLPVETWERLGLSLVVGLVLISATACITAASRCQLLRQVLPELSAQQNLPQNEQCAGDHHKGRDHHATDSAKY